MSNILIAHQMTEKAKEFVDKGSEIYNGNFPKDIDVYCSATRFFYHKPWGLFTAKNYYERLLSLCNNAIKQRFLFFDSSLTNN